MIPLPLVAPQACAQARSADKESARPSLSWVCSTCRTVASFAPGFAAPEQPNGWLSSDAGWTCIACQRAEIVARSEAEGLSGTDAAYELALFEAERTPEATTGEIVKRMEHLKPRPRRHQIETALARVRPRTEPVPRHPAARFPAVAVALFENPRRSNPQIADAAALTGPTLDSRAKAVRRVRQALEEAGAIEVHRA